jgi:hypothetical protein
VGPIRPSTSTSARPGIRAAEHTCLIGSAGTGKSHILVALGVAAVSAGHKVRYSTAADLVETLYRALADNSVGRVIDTLLRSDVIICDELGFAPLDDTGAQLRSASSPPSTNAAPSGSARTGRSSPGAASCPNTHHCRRSKTRRASAWCKAEQGLA